MQFNNAGVFAGDDEFTYDSAGQITLGKATGGSGKINLKGSTSGTVTIEPAPAAGTWTLRLPIDDGSSGEFLRTDGSGVTTWAAAGAGRETVTSARTYYVNNSTGSDANTGLTSGTAFATINKAIAVVCDEIYWINVDPTISVAKTGVNYNEFVVMRPWQGSGTGQGAMAGIFGDATDHTHATGVLVKPTGTAPSTFIAAVSAVGAGANWYWAHMSVDGSATTNAGCYAAQGGAFLRVLSGDMGGPTPGGSQLFANDSSEIHWDSDFTTSSHIYGAGPAFSQTMIFALNHSTIVVNTPIIFDDDPGYWVVAWAEQNSYFSYYHNTGFSGVHPTGQRLFLRENSRGNSSIAIANIPGDSWSSATNYPFMQSGSTFNAHGFPELTTYASLPTTAVLEGSIVSIRDSNTNVPGAAVTSGGGSHRVPLWYTGSSWVVLAPVTAASPAGSTTQVQYNLSGALAGDDEFTYDSAGVITLGKATGAIGKLNLNGSTSGTVGIKVAAAAGTWDLTLPVNDGSPGEFLQTNGSGATIWAAGGGGGGGSFVEDTFVNILASTPTSGNMARASDTDQFFIANGSAWLLATDYLIPEAEEPDLGHVPGSNRIGYGRDYVTDKVIANCSIGGFSSTPTNDGGIRFNAEVGAFGAFEQFSEGEWHSVVSGLVLKEVDDLSQAITQTPLGQTQELIVFNGDSVVHGLNDVPLIQGYLASLGAYPPLQRVTGGTF